MPELSNSEKEEQLLRQIKEARLNLFAHQMDELTEETDGEDLRAQWESVETSLQARVDRLEAKYNEMYGGE
tara:strand:- start:429 stop:641 length:213 start_codon:yes stop_codon:yes gene_type:complete